MAHIQPSRVNPKPKGTPRSTLGPDLKISLAVSIGVLFLGIVYKEPLHSGSILRPLLFGNRSDQLIIAGIACALWRKVAVASERVASRTGSPQTRSPRRPRDPRQASETSGSA